MHTYKVTRKVSGKGEADMEFLKEFIKPELMVLIPVLYLIGFGIKKSQVKDRFIPILLGGIGIVLSGLYVFSTCGTLVGRDILFALFTSITQGILAAGASVYVNQLIKQAGKKE
jgi:hypothetical protein